ncbi:hypothetical protein E2562_006784 [Oryza meyeriana var. granulata]|uniref:Uncharacterized protein n=1 Tax=Oryza meyeriana var. granulata TaxID=110450 RepID=A0A6G1C4I2_9ORYZ|nr:hypothetical protein E2562_006784 [Oryza meyeriana var. granulata]
MGWDWGKREAAQSGGCEVGGDGVRVAGQDGQAQARRYSPGDRGMLDTLPIRGIEWGSEEQINAVAVETDNLRKLLNAKD